MSRVVHPDLQHGQRVEPFRPNFLRRTISRYQLAELFVIIGMILMVWGALSRRPSLRCLKAAVGLARLRAYRDPRRRLDPERATGLPPGGL